LSLRGVILPLLLAAATLAQEALTNDGVVKMVKAGLADDLIVSTVRSEPARYAVGPDDLIALKNAGVSDKVVAAMVERMASPAAVAVPGPAVAAAPAAGLVSEVGVYYKKGGVWNDLQPEVVNFKTGGVLKNLATLGIVKGDINGHINGAHSLTALKCPVDILVYAPEGVAITEYQFLILRDAIGGREFRTVTGGVMHVSGGATLDLGTFESKKLAPRTYEIELTGLIVGEYGFLPPAGADSTGSTGRIGKVYSFSIVE